jgi:hypothetical protein
VKYGKGEDARGSVVVEELSYKPEGRGFESRQVHLIFSIYLILLPTTLGHEFTQPLTEISSRSIKIIYLGSRERPVLRADNLAICEPIFKTMRDPQNLTIL